MANSNGGIHLVTVVRTTQIQGNPIHLFSRIIYQVSTTSHQYLFELELLLFSSSVCPTLCEPMDCSMPVFPLLHHLMALALTHVLWVSDAIQQSHPLSSPSPAFNLAQNEGLYKLVSSFHQVAKVLEVSFSISPSNEYSRLISFRINWFVLLVVQGTPKNLL